MVKRNLYSDVAVSGGFGFDVFTEDEINKIHLATLEVMEKTGLYVGTPEALDILEGGGARVTVKRKTRSSHPIWWRIVSVQHLITSFFTVATPNMMLSWKINGSISAPSVKVCPSWNWMAPCELDQ